MLYGHGDDFYNAKNEVKINFSYFEKIVGPPV